MPAIGLADTLERLYKQQELPYIIAVAVHAGKGRMQEYGTAGRPDYKNRGSKAGAYSRFILEELWPFLQERYHMSAHSKQTAIAGFSLGGLSAANDRQADSISTRIQRSSDLFIKPTNTSTMPQEKIEFENANGEKLAARLELPVNQRPYAFALFAHCFTCSKNLTAVRNIGRALIMNGIGVLRFDFTGLGESEGDFADTNFSSNVEDLIQAARFLEEQYQAPALLVGHSLGGAAVICAAHELPSVKAVATIGAPYSPDHVSHLLSEKMEDIEEDGVAEVSIGNRPFTVKKQFLEDIRSQNLEPKLKELDRALLILHSPQDQVVEIENAARMYKAARHPKSYISLDRADHLLMKKADSLYAGEMIASWVSRYVQCPEKEELEVKKEVAVRLGEEGFTTDVMMRRHSLTADEPESVGGNDYGPSPYELVTAGLGTCTAMTLQMYARRKKWPLKEVRVHLEHYKDHAEDCENVEDPKSKIDHFSRHIELEGELDENQRKRLLEIANKCPVHRTLHNPIKIITELAEE